MFDPFVSRSVVMWWSPLWVLPLFVMIWIGIIALSLFYVWTDSSRPAYLASLGHALWMQYWETYSDTYFETS